MVLGFALGDVPEGWYGVVWKCPVAVFRPADTLRPERSQPFAVQVEVDQGKFAHSRR
jgi:hypothetical protein